MAYATAAQVAAWLNWDNTTAEDTEKLTRLAETASATVERLTARQFEQVTETRLFDAPTISRTLTLGDTVSISQVELRVNRTDFETVPTSDWVLFGGKNGRPHYKIRMLHRNIYQGDRMMRIQGIWGWHSVPADIVQATLMEAARLALRDQSPQGAATEGLPGGFGGGTEIPVTGIDYDFMSIVDNYKIPTFGQNQGYTEG